MQVKTFIGNSSQDVLAQIKAEMGPDAVILGNRTYRKNGVLFHEMTVGLERQSKNISVPLESSSNWHEWQKDWMQIKKQLFALMKPAIQMERLTPRQRVALEYLQREGVSDAVTVELYKRLLAAPGSSILECLGDMVKIKGWGEKEWGQRIHLLVGPYGSGKTTTALRFALQLRKNNPETEVAFINTDCLRGNGRLILRHWAELSNFIYMEAADEAGIRASLQRTAASAVFVDVPGFARGQNLATWRSAMGLDSLDTATHLVLSPFCDALQIQEFLARYRCDGPSSLVWTKLDEAVCFGSIVNISSQAGLPISALSYGAELQDSLSSATEPLVWRLVFKRQLPGRENTQ